MMNELLWYYLQTREVLVQLHRVRDDDEVQRVLVQEEEEVENASLQDKTNMNSNNKN